MSSWKVHKDVDIYFVTSSIIGWTAIFKNKPFFSIIIDSLIYCATQKGLIIYGYVIMPDHIHLLVNGNGKLSDIMRDFKTFTSRKLTELLIDKGHESSLNVFRQAAFECEKSDFFKVWQNGFHPIAIHSEKFYTQKLDYIHHNPVKRGYVIKPEHWLYSSARNYAGIINRPMEVEIL